MLGGQYLSFTGASTGIAQHNTPYKLFDLDSEKATLFLFGYGNIRRGLYSVTGGEIITLMKCLYVNREDPDVYKLYSDGTSVYFRLNAAGVQLSITWKVLKTL